MKIYQLVIYTAITVIVILLVLSLAAKAHAHEWYDDATPMSGESCCGGDDCQIIEDKNRVKETPFKWILDGKWTFDKGQMGLPSRDNNYHVCIRDGEPKCFFYITPDV